VKHKRFRTGLFSGLALFFDCGLAFAGSWLAWHLMFRWFRPDMPMMGITYELRWIVPLVYLSFTFFAGSSLEARTKTIPAQVIGLYRAAIYALFVIIGVVFLLKDYQLSRGFVLTYLSIAPLLVAAGRSALYRLNLLLLRRGWGRVRTVVIGSGQAAKEIFDHLAINQVLGYEMVGFLVDSSSELTFEYGGVKAIGLHRDCGQVLASRRVQQVFIPWVLSSVFDNRDVLQVCQEQGVSLKVVSHRIDLLLRAAHIDEVTGVTLVDSHQRPLRTAGQAVKRAADILGSALILLALAPLFLVVMAAIMIDSRGGVFFRQERVGAGVRPFRLLKFRTMVAGADQIRQQLEPHNEADGPIFKIRNDPRVTSVGRWLRRFSLDELPQLINVLKGDMSLVGPRPPLPSEVAQYQSWHRQRLAGPQGMTGLWQISGRSELKFDEMALLDIYYLEHWSPALDLAILFKTVPVVLLGKGAY
jgi:exopolysaccharide biosynthesis polyprenyl glycosylphosphotransferase